MGMRWPAVVVLACCAASASADDGADSILVGGRILTVDAGDRVVEALAIKDGRILATGTRDEIERARRTRHRAHRPRGPHATPGLIDAHAHFSTGGLLRLTNVDLSFPQVKAIADIARLAAGRAAGRGCRRLGPRAAAGTRASSPNGACSRAADLDPVTGGHPVWLVQTSGHYGVANPRRSRSRASRAGRPTRPAAASTATPTATRRAS